MHATVVDALNDAQYVDDVVKQVGKIDLVLDAAGPLAKDYGNGKVVGQSEGPMRGLQELHAIGNSEQLASPPFYHAALGEFEHRNGKNDAAAQHFSAALALARNPAERHFLEQRIRACDWAVHAG